MSSKILVVDDSQLMNQMIQDILEAADYDVHTASNGKEALELVESWEPDLILLDVMMPEMDGFEVCRRIRSDSSVSEIPIILITAKASITDKQRGFESGADDYLTKPFEPVELKLRLEALLKRSHSGREDESAPGQRVIAVHSLRGGSGSTSLAVNIAVGLHKLWDVPVGLVDLVRPMGVCCSMLNMQPFHRLDDIVQQPIENIDADMIASYLSAHESGVKLMGGFSDPVAAEKLNENLVTFLLSLLKKMLPYIVIDCSHDYSASTIAALDMADVVVVPVIPDINAARLAQQELKMFGTLGYEESPFLVQNWTFARQGIQRARLEQYLKQPFDFVIPYSEQEWSEAINTGVPVVEGDSETPIVRMLEDLSWRLSIPEMRANKPDCPTAAWTRIFKRQSRNQDAAGRKKPED